LYPPAVVIIPKIDKMSYKCQNRLSWDGLVFRDGPARRV
jgi:hypothetical protein